MAGSSSSHSVQMVIYRTTRASVSCCGLTNSHRWLILHKCPKTLVKLASNSVWCFQIVCPWLREACARDRSLHSCKGAICTRQSVQRNLTAATLQNCCQECLFKKVSLMACMTATTHDSMKLFSTHHSGRHTRG